MFCPRLVVFQGRLRGHVRKRSEGSSFRGCDDSASRRSGFSREEKGKWLVEEYGKVQKRLIRWLDEGACELGCELGCGRGCELACLQARLRACRACLLSCERACRACELVCLRAYSCLLMSLLVCACSCLLMSLLVCLLLVSLHCTFACTFVCVRTCIRARAMRVFGGGAGPSIGGRRVYAVCCGGRRAEGGRARGAIGLCE